MNLVIDGSFDEINLSIFKEKELVYDLFVSSSYTHSKILVGILDYALKSLDVDIAEIKNVYVCIGPGRYTSLRVVLSTIKGIFFERLKYIYTVNRLDLMAANINRIDKPFRVVCKTSPSIIYCADYINKNGIVSRISSMQRIEKEDFETEKPNKESLTKNIFLINPKQISKIELEKLTPIY